MAAEHIGYIRFIFIKTDGELGPFDSGIDVLESETFDAGFVMSRSEFGPMNWTHKATSELGPEEQIAEAAKNLPAGFYEMYGEVWYEYDPGLDTPNGPAEPDDWWWLQNEKFLKLTDKQIGWISNGKSLDN